MGSALAGKLAPPSLLVNVPRLVTAYYTEVPDPAQPGERVILFPYEAIPAGHPYSESGPIFVHADRCQRYSATREYPSDFRNGRVFRAYNANCGMIDAEVVNGSEPEAVVEKLLQNPETAFVHARSVTHGCYTFGVERI